MEKFIYEPCPFCGANEQLFESNFKLSDEDYDDTNPIFWHVICDASTENKERGCGSSSGFKETKSAALSCWNSRIK